MSHIVLLGDSIFDNASYVPGGPSVIEHLRRGLPADEKATLLAVDGAVVSGVSEQLPSLPADATHLVISAGGNDALGYSGLIYRPTAQILNELTQARRDFEREYREMLRAASSRGLPTVLCTVYENVPGLSPEAQAGLCLFNDVIIREAFRAGLTLIDLRLICTDAADYSSVSPIEPSAQGGRKIARAVQRAVETPAGSIVV